MATANQKQESAKLSPQERTQRMQALSQARHALFVAEKLTRASAKARKATAQAFLDAHNALPGAPVMSEAEGVAIRACLGLGPKASTEQVLSALHPGLVRLNSRVTTAKRISARASARHASLSAAERPKKGDVSWFRCIDCGQEYRLETFEEVCPFCGSAAGEGFYAPPSHKPAKGKKPGEKAASAALVVRGLNSSTRRAFKGQCECGVHYGITGTKESCPGCGKTLTREPAARNRRDTL